MQGMTIESLKKHYSLIPLYCVLFSGIGAAILSLGRAALKSPDVSWNLKKNPEPWQEYANKDYKLMNPAAARGFTERMERPTDIWDLFMR